MRVVNVSEMRAVEERAGRDFGLTSEILMDHAGHSVASSLGGRLGGELSTARILVLVGPGNNGGDGRVMGSYLSTWGARVAYYVWKEQRLDPGVDGSWIPSGAAEPADPGHLAGAFAAALATCTVVVDALLGTGTSRPLPSQMREVLDLVRQEKERRPDLLLLAVDLPTGLNADTGEVDPGTFRADITVTLAFPKLGLLFFPGAGFVGELEVGGIGLPAELTVPPGPELLDDATIRRLLPPRPLDSNKGTFGKVLIAAGSPAYPGSAYLAATAAGRIGAGLVTLAISPTMAPIYAGKLSEATFHLLPPENEGPESRAGSLLAALSGYAALVIGPGLGQAPATGAFLQAIFAGLRQIAAESRPRLVVDADGLNYLATTEHWWDQLPEETVITPHPGEMARLQKGAAVTGGGIDRLDMSRRAARGWNLTLVLKGAHTLIAEPGGSLSITAPANPALATAGTGDVLAGTIGGLLAQGLAPYDAARAGVYLHSRAGLRVAMSLGDSGLLASDLLPELPRAQAAVKVDGK
jgi:ADP-dependent NAD(P)H-hydrate dehydratase / NAD(P)H-hydrate epimerase